MFCGPSHGGDFRAVLNGCVCEAGQDVSEVVTDWDLESSTALHNREDGPDARSGLFTADVDPVGAAKRDWAHRVFGEIGAQFQLRIIEESGESFPDRQRVSACLPRGALG